MADDMLTEGGNTFNQSSSSSTSDLAYRLLECVDKLELANALFVKAKALSYVAVTSDAVRECEPWVQQHYQDALDELIVAGVDQLADVLSGLRRDKLKI